MIKKQSSSTLQVLFMARRTVLVLVRAMFVFKNCTKKVIKCNFCYKSLCSCISEVEVTTRHIWLACLE